MRSTCEVCGEPIQSFQDYYEHAPVRWYHVESHEATPIGAHDGDA